MLQDVPSFLTYWRNARGRTVRVLEALRPEDLEWAPAPGAFTFGDLFRHLAGLERFMYAENVQGRTVAPLFGLTEEEVAARSTPGGRE